MDRFGDCGFQGRQRRKLAISRRPVAWLFSGWNWVPITLSRADDGGDRPAIVDMRQQMRGVGHAELVGVDEIGVVAGGDARPAPGAAGRSPDRSSPCAAPSAPGRRGRSGPPRRRSSRSPRRRFVFEAPRRQHLHADADAEEGAALDASPPRRSPRTARHSSPSARRQAGKAPSPGSTMRSARATSSGRAVTRTSPPPTSAAMR